METPRKLKLLISYDGGSFQGWQVQHNGPSIQAALADAIEKVTGKRVVPIGSGRTDSGVHALGQVAHFRTLSRLEPERMLRALNFYLPETIVVREVTEVPDSFHARKSARAKLYRYVIHDGPVPDPFSLRYAWKVAYRLDAGRMGEAAAALVGTHDFRSFETEYPNRASSVRTIIRADVSRLGDFVMIDLASTGFLYNMVRSIAGTLFQIGRGKWDVERMREVLTALDRTVAGPTAPAHGLFLVRVDYPDLTGA